jgi:hypothetical protein
MGGIMRTPPPFDRMLLDYFKENPDKTLRLGQWFCNNFMENQAHSLFYMDFDESYDTIVNMYEFYQW